MEGSGRMKGYRCQAILQVSSFRYDICQSGFTSSLISLCKFHLVFSLAGVKVHTSP